MEYVIKAILLTCLAGTNSKSGNRRLNRLIDQTFEGPNWRNNGPIRQEVAQFANTHYGFGYLYLGHSGS